MIQQAQGTLQGANYYTVFLRHLRDEGEDWRTLVSDGLFCARITHRGLSGNQADRIRNWVGSQETQIQVLPLSLKTPQILPLAKPLCASGRSGWQISKVLYSFRTVASRTKTKAALETFFLVPSYLHTYNCTSLRNRKEKICRERNIRKTESWRVLTLGEPFMEDKEQFMSSQKYERLLSSKVFMHRVVSTQRQATLQPITLMVQT